MIYGVIAGLMIIILVQLVYAYHLDERRRLYANELCDRWIAERQQLLDRIQAPSFDHLKQAEVRIIKAQKEEKKDTPIEYV